MNNVFQSAPILEAEELTAWTGGRWEGGRPEGGVKGVIQDSRQVWPGALFVALSRGRRNGCGFIADAARAGAAAAMAGYESNRGETPVPILRVKNPLDALSLAAAGYRLAVAPHVIGVTGSMGKTTVKEMISSMLYATAESWSTYENWNNQIGVPLSLLNMPRQTREAVFEIGTNHPGELKPLCEILKPDAAVITNIAEAHIGNFGDLRAIAREKAEILSAVPPSGFAVLDCDSEWFEYLRSRARCRVIGVSMHAGNPAAQVSGRLLDELDGRVEISGSAFEAPFRIRSGLPGEHNARNLIMAVAAVRMRGMASNRFEAALKRFSLPPMRWQKQSLGSRSIINDAYNANPPGMRLAIETFARMPASEHILVLGDMFELGDRGPAEHKRIGELLGSGQWKRVILLGELTRWTVQAALKTGFPPERIFHVETHEQAANRLWESAGPGSVVLVKASRGMHLERVVDLMSAKCASPAGFPATGRRARPHTEDRIPPAPPKTDVLVRNARRALVLGGGVSGMAAARLLTKIGIEVTILDQGDNPRAEDLRARIQALGLKAPRLATLPPHKTDLAVISPGIELSHPWVKSLLGAGVPLIGECELASALWKGKLLAVSGSKGKSSVVKLCAEALQAGGFGARACGNYGIPLSELVCDFPDLEWAVLEVSSFQLETMVDFRPDIGILLNILPDHLDRHKSMSAYRRLKFGLFANQSGRDAAFLPQGLRVPRGIDIPARILRFGSGNRADWRYAPGLVTGKDNGETWRIHVAGSWFDNEMIGPQAAAAMGALFLCGVDRAKVATALAEFEPLPHRMQPVASIAGVNFVDDSKATSLDALVASAGRIGRGTVRLIAGGRLKKDNPLRVKEKLAPLVRKVYCVGESATVLRKAWESDMDCRESGTLAAAVKEAWRESRPGETILLAPGCASFDQFENFEQRGQCFARLVRALRSQDKKTSGGDAT